jgi:hypothetical protein
MTARRPLLAWSPRELAKLQALYPARGLAACREALPLRTAIAIRQKAQELRLRSKPAKRGGRLVPLGASPEIDAAILNVRANANRDTLTAIGRRFDRPLWWIWRRAAKLGMVVSRTHPLWTEAEIALLHATAHLTASHVTRLFRARGFNRTEAAIELRRRDERVAPSDNGFYSAAALGALLGCSDHLVSTWCRREGLRAQRRGIAGADTHARDHYLIADRDFRAWLLANPERLDLRKVPRASHAWLIELLGRGGTAPAHALAKVA